LSQPTEKPIEHSPDVQLIDSSKSADSLNKDIEPHNSKLMSSIPEKQELNSAHDQKFSTLERENGPHPALVNAVLTENKLQELGRSEPGLVEV